MIEYKAIYKCRMCGEEFISAATGSVDVAIKNMVKVTTGCEIKQFIGCPVNATSMHSCSDGSLGLADFLGFRKVEDGNGPD